MVRKGMDKLTMRLMRKTDVLCNAEVAETGVTAAGGIAAIVATMTMTAMLKTMKVKMKLWTLTAAMMRRSMTTMTSCTRRDVLCSAEEAAEVAAVVAVVDKEEATMEAMEATTAEILMVARTVEAAVEAAVGVEAAVAAAVGVEAAEAAEVVEAMASSVAMPTSLSLLKTSSTTSGPRSKPIGP